jgi:hypothetical protein
MHNLFLSEFRFLKCFPIAVPAKKLKEESVFQKRLEGKRTLRECKDCCNRNHTSAAPSDRNKRQKLDHQEEGDWVTLEELNAIMQAVCKSAPGPSHEFSFLVSPTASIQAIIEEIQNVDGYKWT